MLLRAVRAARGPRGRWRAVAGATGPCDLCSGPGKLAQAFGVDRAPGRRGPRARNDGVWIEAGSPVEPSDVAAGIRVGVSVGLDREWRFRVAGDPFVSQGRPGPPR